MEAKNDANYSIGIDFGNTFSRIGVWENNSVKIISTEEDDRELHSMVAFLNEKERKIGNGAMSVSCDTEYVPIVYDLKRLIGRKIDDKEIEKDKSNWPFSLVEDEEKKIQIEIKPKKIKNNEEKENNEKKIDIYGPSICLSPSLITQRYYPEQISAMIIKQLKENAKLFF